MQHLTAAKPVAVIGADLDVPLVRSLVKGDEVLLEMNGVRVYTLNACPLVAEIPWTVQRNDKEHLVLRHEKIAKPLSLPYSALISESSPAVFKIFNSAYGTSGPIYTILQFVGFHCHDYQVDELFPSPFNEEQCREAFDDERVKVGLLEQWGKTFKHFKTTGFSYTRKNKSIKRLALRSHVPEADLRSIRNLEWDKMLDFDINTLVNIHRELCWMPHFLNQNAFISHDINAEHVDEQHPG